MQNPKISSIINVTEKKYDKQKSFFVKFIFVKNIFFLTWSYPSELKV